MINQPPIDNSPTDSSAIDSSAADSSLTDNCQPKTAGLILAGGLSTRMHAKDKSFVTINGKPLIQYVIDGLSKQVEQLYISANPNNAKMMQSFGYPVIVDTLDRQGPLGGIYSALLALSDYQYIACASCDSPFLPPDFVYRLVQHGQAKQCLITYAQSAPTRLTNAEPHPDNQGKTPKLDSHYTHSLWSTSMLSIVERCIHTDILSLRRVISSASASAVIFKPEHHQAFFYNVNTPEDLAQLHAFIASL